MGGEPVTTGRGPQQTRLLRASDPRRGHMQQNTRQTKLPSTTNTDIHNKTTDNKQQLPRTKTNSSGRSSSCGGDAAELNQK